MKKSEHQIEYEHHSTFGRRQVWVDCSCGWFHNANNRDQAKELALRHKESDEHQSTS